MLKTTISIAKKGGEVLLKYFGANAFSIKGGHYDMVGLVSEADIASEKVILEGLQNNFPKHNFFSEEKGFIDNNSKFTWYIDPLDGTSNFIRKIPLFGISVGLVEEKEPILGVLYFPALNLLVYAEKGKGVFCNNKKIVVSKRKLHEALYYGRGYYKGKLYLDQGIAKKVGLTKIIDSSAYELAQIAMGNAEIYVLVSIPHDIVAGIIIIREAGGKVTDFNGQDWKLDSKNIIATNGVVHNDVLKYRTLDM